MSVKKSLVFVLSAALTLSFALPAFAENTPEEQAAKDPANQIMLDVNKGIVNLELCEGETTFSDPKEVALIAKEYNLGDAGKIDEIRYVPIADASEMARENVEFSGDSEAQRPLKARASTSYYIKKKSYSDVRGGTIRSSWYRYPGGTMTVSTTIARTYSFSANAGISVSDKIVKAALSSGYNFSLSKSDTVSDSQNVSVKAKHKRNVTAYVNKRIYKGELWKKYLRKGDWVHTKCGNTKINRAVGVIFVIGKNVKL